MADIDLSEYMGAYIDGSRENLDTMDRMLLNLEQNPQNLDAIEQIFRAAHTLKGMSATMGFEKVAHLTHEMESVLDKLRTKQMPVTPAVIDVIFETFDVLRTLVNDTITQTDSGVGLDAVTAKLHSLMVGGGAPTGDGDAHAAPEAGPPAEEESPPVEETAVEAATEAGGDAGGLDPTILADLMEVALSEFELSGLIEVQQSGMIPYLLRVNLVADCLLKGPRIFMVLRTLDSAHCEIVKSLPEVKDLENEKFDRSFKMVITTDHPFQEIKDGIESISEVEDAHLFQLNPEAIRAGDLGAAVVGGSLSGAGTPAAGSEAPPPPPPEPEPAPPPPPPPPKPKAAAAAPAPAPRKAAPPPTPVVEAPSMPAETLPAPVPESGPPAGAPEEEPVEEILKETIVQLVSFRMAGETYALGISQVVGIINLIPITRVPKAPTHIAGVINLRGEIVPVINLRKKLKLPEIDRAPTMQIIILSFEEEKVKVGFLVDTVSEVLRLPESNIEPPSHVSESVDIEHLRGVGKIQNKIIILLNAHKIVFG